MSFSLWYDASNTMKGTSEEVTNYDSHEKLESEDYSHRTSVCIDVSDVQRKSVICAVTDISPEGDMSDGEESSCGSSLVLDMDPDTADDTALKFKSDPSEFEPSVNPSEVECVLSDTSGDESDYEKDPLDVAHVPQESMRRRLSCFLCTYVVVDEGNPSELAKHLQSNHKFSVRKLRHSSLTNKHDSYSEDSNQKGSKTGFTCSKTSGGCGAVFFSKQALKSHHVRSKTAGSSCWHAAHRSEQGKPVLTCPMCPFQSPSRKGMISHLENYHDCLKNVDDPMSAFMLQCRACKTSFWTVAERSKHEVSEHVNDATYFTLKCHLCLAKFSSKVCLKNHFKQSHSDEEQYGGLGFRCRRCYLTFPSFTLVQEHFRLLHRSLLVYHCEKCGLILKTRKTYQVHLKNTECGSVQQECSLCNKILWSKRALSIHFRMKHFNSSRVGFLCRICKMQFNTKSDRTQHYAMDHKGDSPFTCPICNKGFASKSGMYGHRQTHSTSSVSKCGICGKEFIRRDSYYEHLLIHNGPRHKCSFCSKEFVQRSNLVRHIRIHTGEKPYKCSHCDKTFSDKGACNSHIRVHTRSEACSCPYCGQVFSKKQKLKYHMRKHTGEDLVNCEVCGKTFTNSHSLKEHRVIHDHRIQIMCTYCGKAYSSAKYLQRHIAMSHEAVVMYKCPLCNRGFPQQARLKTHLMTHSSVKHLRCLLCSKAYSSNRSLRRHLLNDHNITSEHPDFKQCFYVMTPEEAGVNIGAVQAIKKQPLRRPNMNITEVQAIAKQLLLRPKSEPFSSDSEFDDHESLSEEDEVPHVANHETILASTLQPSPCPIKTKAARKQLPFSVSLTEKKVMKSRKSSPGSSSKAKPNQITRVGSEVGKQCFTKGKLIKSTRAEVSRGKRREQSVPSEPCPS